MAIAKHITGLRDRKTGNRYEQRGDDKPIPRVFEQAVIGIVEREHKRRELNGLGKGPPWLLRLLAVWAAAERGREVARRKGEAAADRELVATIERLRSRKRGGQSGQ